MMKDRKLWRRWIKALRSGKYKQARGVLRTIPKDGEKEGYCCLGVLLDIADPDGWRKRRVVSLKGGRAHRRADERGKADNLSSTTRTRFGIGEQAYTLTSMNDRGRSFRRIAAWIEKHL